MKELHEYTIIGPNNSTTKNSNRLSVTTNPNELPAFLKLWQELKYFTNNVTKVLLLDIVAPNHSGRLSVTANPEENKKKKKFKVDTEIE